MLSEKQFESLKKANLSVDLSKSKERISGDFKSASSEAKKQIIKLSGLTRTTFYNAFQKGTASPKMVLAMAQMLGVSPYYYTGESDDKGEFNDGVLTGFLQAKKLTVAGARKASAAKTKTAETKPKAAKAKATKAVKAPAKAKTTAKVKPGPKSKAAKPVAKSAAKKTAVKPAAAKSAAAKSDAVKPAAAKRAKNVKEPALKPAPAAKKKDEILMQISIEKTPKLQKAVNQLDEESAVLLLRALIRKADANDNAKALCDIIKSCLLS
ncbi:MAG: hypothetical protein FWG44_07975 [Oscillospiraceae bacterium]|nr:hypothetical protein [Oscillospiraceae bacterium]